MCSSPFAPIHPVCSRGRRSGVSPVLAFFVAVLLALGSGCAASMKRRDLESVARDWSYTIRAGQVLPVYPPSEDVRPGDLFLVQMPIDQQKDVFRDLGFLPLDNLLARVEPTGYATFYGDSSGLGSSTSPLPDAFTRSAGKGWSRAPTAGFPSYTFSVGRDSRGSVAISLTGVPVGMSLLNSSAADGSVTIADVRTYGVDTSSLFNDVTRWALDPRNREMLKHYGPSESKKLGLFSRTRYNHLRIVSRVYVTRRVIVSLRDTSARSGRVDSGLPDTADLFEAAAGGSPDGVKRYEQSLRAVNGALDKALAADRSAPGGTLQVIAASPRSVTMDETLLTPLVIGYLGFDMKIFENGELGPPVPTHAILTGNADTPDLIFQPNDPSVMCINRWLSVSDRDERRARIQRLETWWAERQLPDPDRAPTRIATNHYAVARTIFIAETPIDCAAMPIQ